MIDPLRVRIELASYASLIAEGAQVVDITRRASCSTPRTRHRASAGFGSSDGGPLDGDATDIEALPPATTQKLQIRGLMQQGDLGHGQPFALTGSLLKFGDADP
ncbi:hypothetical protein BDM02DRAFT_3120578, partial [Thelephora ganbajun]